jgi:hypothetical protein
MYRGNGMAEIVVVPLVVQSAPVQSRDCLMCHKRCLLELLSVVNLQSGNSTTSRRQAKDSPTFLLFFTDVAVAGNGGTPVRTRVRTRVPDVMAIVFDMAITLH